MTVITINIHWLLLSDRHHAGSFTHIISLLLTTPLGKRLCLWLVLSQRRASAVNGLLERFSACKRCEQVGRWHREQMGPPLRTLERMKHTLELRLSPGTAGTHLLTSAIAGHSGHVQPAHKEDRCAPVAGAHLQAGRFGKVGVGDSGRGHSGTPRNYRQGTESIRCHGSSCLFVN